MRLTPQGLSAFGRLIPCTLGRSGIRAGSAKAEGDAATPAANMRITACLYRPDRLGAPAPWAVPLGLDDLWCDAPEHAEYNRLVRGPLAASHEVMRRADPLYDIVLVTDWNSAPAQPGRGSAIFVHQWRQPGYPTAGCIAMDRGGLIWLAARARPGTTLLVPALAGHGFQPRRHEGA